MFNIVPTLSYLFVAQLAYEQIKAALPDAELQVDGLGTGGVEITFKRGPKSYPFVAAQFPGTVEAFVARMVNNLK